MILRDVLRAGYRLIRCGKYHCGRVDFTEDTLTVRAQRVGSTPGNFQEFTFNLDDEIHEDMYFQLNVSFSEELAHNLLLANTVPLDKELITSNRYWSAENKTFRHFE